MEMAEMKIKVPKPFVAFFRTEMPKDPHSVLVQNALLLYPYIKNDGLSYGRAAEMLGIRKTQIMDLYEEMELPLVSYDVSEVDDDVAAIRRVVA